jgi:hypothetical protein
MLETIRTLGVNQLSRQAAAVDRLAGFPAPASGPPSAAGGLGDMALEGLRRRNAMLDGVFYDVRVVSSAEAHKLSPWLAAEGAIVLAPPTGAGMIRVCATIEDFIAAGGRDVRSLAVAGVGSSALGTAAFARNVADATGAPVAAVVSGYGLSDLLTEALGGYFLFGQLNGLRHAFEAPSFTGGSKPAGASAEASMTGAGDVVRRSRDTQTVAQLLTDQRLGFSLLTGHSKGNLVISEALYGIYEADRDLAKRIADRATIVTVSAVIAMPPVCRRVIDVIGAWDWFGGLNSRHDIAPDVVVPRAWHHTNTELPAHLDVRAVFAGLDLSAGAA